MRPLRRRALAFALGALLAAPAFAQDGDEPMLLDLCINQRCIGVAAVVVRGDDALVDREALRIAKIDIDGVATERIGEREYVSLKALNHGSRYAVDRALLRLDLTLRPELLPSQRADLRRRATADSGEQPWSALLNYAATMGEREERNLFVDVAIGRGNGALRSTGAWDTDAGWRRGLTRFELDRPHALRRWTVGDQFAVPRDPLGGGLLLGGIGVERAFDQDPYLVTFPQPFYTGVLESPGTVEVYANGVLIGRQSLDAGPFTLEHLGIQPGRNDVRLVVRDPFGNRSELASRSYYGSTPRLLARGLDEYALRVGRARTEGGLGGGYADDTALQGWYRRGLGDAFTLGGRIEGDDTLRNAGLDGALRLPAGEIALAVSASEDEDVDGRAWAANYSYGTPLWSLGLGVRRAGAGYRTLGDPLAALLGPLRVDDYLSLALSPNARLSLHFNAGRQRRDGDPVERNAGVAATLRLAPRAQLFASVQRRESGTGHDTVALLSLDISLGRDSIGFNTGRRETPSGDRHGYGFDARRSRPAGTGWGYDLSLQRDDGSAFDFGQFEYQGEHGRYALQMDRVEGETRARAIASGALVAIGGRLFATPPTQTGFALVRVPGLPGVPILRENLDIGRTDAHGDLLVRDLLPFHANKLALEEAAVPAGYALRVPRREVAIPRNAGALVLLDAAPVHAVTGRLVHAGAAVDGFAIRMEGDDTPRMPLGATGRFYIEDLASGVHLLAVEGATAPLRCRVDVPARKDAGITDLGDIQCEDVP